jgi:hypothetical protein
MTTQTQPPIRWTQITPDRDEYRVETPIGPFDLWCFGPNRIWFVADADTDETVWHGASMEHGLDAIRNVVSDMVVEA